MTMRTNGNGTASGVITWQWVAWGVMIVVFALASGWGAHVELTLTKLEARQQDVRERLLALEQRVSDMTHILDRIEDLTRENHRLLADHLRPKP